MSRSFRLTRRVEESLVEIALWTIETFGPGQADIYEAELLSRCDAIVNGQAHSRSCSILVDDAADLRYLRAGEHFLVFLDLPEEVIIVDILHSAAICRATLRLLQHLDAMKIELIQRPAALVRFTRNLSRRRW